LQAALSFEQARLLSTWTDWRMSIGRRRKYDEAEAVYKRSLALCEAADGISPCLRNCTEKSREAVTTKCGKYAKAEPLFKRALEVVEVPFRSQVDRT